MPSQSPSDPPSSGEAGGAFRRGCLSRRSRRVPRRPPASSSAGESFAQRMTGEAGSPSLPTFLAKQESRSPAGGEHPGQRRAKQAPPAKSKQEQQNQGDKTNGPPPRHQSRRIRRPRPLPHGRDDPRRPRRRSRAHRTQARPRRQAGFRPVRSQDRHPQPLPPRRHARSQEARRPRRRARAGRQSRHPRRRLPPRRDGAPRRRAGRQHQGQPAPRLWPHDRLGPDRAAGPRGRARHQLPVPLRRALRHRRARRQAGGAAQPGGRLRRRRDAAGGRRARRTHRGAQLRQRSGGGCGDDRRLRAADDDDVHPQGDGPVGADAGQQPARRRCALLRHLPLCRRQVRLHRPHRAAVLRAVPAEGRHRRSGLQPAVGSRPLARTQDPRRRTSGNPYARRMVRGVRRQRRLRGCC